MTFPVKRRAPELCMQLPLSRGPPPDLELQAKGRASPPSLVPLTTVRLPAPNPCPPPAQPPMLDTFYSNWSKLIAEARLLLCDPLPQPQKEKHIFFVWTRPAGEVSDLRAKPGPRGNHGLEGPSWHRHSKTPVTYRASAFPSGVPAAPGLRSSASGREQRSQYTRTGQPAGKK